jgi:hypothetical protein
MTFIKPNSRTIKAGQRKRMGAYQALPLILLWSKARPNNVFAPSQPSSFRTRITAAMTGQNAISELMGRLTGSSSGSDRSATGPMTQIGIESRKTKEKKLRGDLFPDALHKRFPVMMDTPFLAYCRVAHHGCCQPTALDEVRTIVPKERKDVMPQTGNPAGDTEGDRGGR